MNRACTLAVCSLCFLVPLVVGCPAKGPKLVKAAGTVTYKGAPVSGATITFVYPDKDIATGSTDENGKFSLTTGGRAGAPVGKAKVSISKIKTGTAVTKAPQELRPQDMMKMAATSKEGMKGAQEAETDELPARYKNPDTSALEATVPAEGVEDLTYALVE